MSSGSLSRLAAFTTSPDGGNPAGVWVGEALPEPDEMQRIAAEVGFSETAFVAPADGLERVIRYFSPEAEVPFCGHATIATGVKLGEDGGDATYTLSTTVGEVPPGPTPGRGTWCWPPRKPSAWPSSTTSSRSSRRSCCATA